MVLVKFESKAWAQAGAKFIQSSYFFCIHSTDFNFCVKKVYDKLFFLVLFVKWIALKIIFKNSFENSFPGKVKAFIGVVLATIQQKGNPIQSNLSNWSVELLIKEALSLKKHFHPLLFFEVPLWLFT